MLEVVVVQQRQTAAPWQQAEGEHEEWQLQVAEVQLLYQDPLHVITQQTRHCLSNAIHGIGQI